MTKPSSHDSIRGANRAPDSRCTRATISAFFINIVEIGAPSVDENGPAVVHQESRGGGGRPGRFPGARAARRGGEESTATEHIGGRRRPAADAAMVPGGADPRRAAAKPGAAPPSVDV